MMIIPPEAIPPAPALGTSKESDNPPSVGPVSHSAALADDLSGSPQRKQTPNNPPTQEKRPFADTRRENPASLADAGTASSATTAKDDAQQDAALPQIERRKAERRSENRPVLLDTRTQRARRKASDDAGINVKV